MKFRTSISIQKYPFQLDYHSRIFGLGSCFVDNIKKKFDYYQFRNQINDFGTVFNPVSIHNLLQRIVNQDVFDENDLFFHNDIWKSFDLHSQFNSPDKKALLQNLNQKIIQNYEFVKQTDLVIITLGTAWVYRHKKTQKIVANCHKVAQTEFDKLLLSPAEIVDSLSNIIKAIKSLNNHCKILFSISPVRHLRDGFIENQQSKAHLITAVHQVINKQDILYFPSYEIMIDDLRDYRFYDYDMLHPNATAVDYIWKLFTQNLIKPEAHSTMQQVEKVRKAQMHKAFDANSPAYQKHLQKLALQIENLQKSYPWMEF